MGPTTLLPLLVLFSLAPRVTPHAKDFKEGKIGPGDIMICDCVFDRKGRRGYTMNLDISFENDFVQGTIITCIDVLNTKDRDLAVIDKISGGVNSGTVAFNIMSQQHHGAKFQFRMWGRVPKGKTQNKVVGNCIKP